MTDLEVGVADAVVISGELSELLSRPVSPARFVATIFAELVELADQEGGDAYQDITDDELLKEPAGEVG
jgi:hypothetical protein